jgi:signal transduction histidine kinase
MPPIIWSFGLNSGDSRFPSGCRLRKAGLYFMLNPAVIIGIIGASLGLLMAAYSLGMSRSPFWAERRPFVFVAITAAGYCAFDVTLAMDLPAATIAASVQIALAFGIAQSAAWIRYLAIADERPMRPAERRMVWIGAAIALAGFVPGLLMTRELFTYRVEWLGVTYRTPQPTLLGLLCYVYLVAALWIVAAGARHRWHDGWQARLPIISVLVLGVLALNDTLSSAGILQMPLLLDAGSIIIVSIVCVMHEQRFSANVHQLERASSELKHEVASRTQALLDAQGALASSERLAGLGRLTAGVAHEINNPIAVVRHSLERIRDRADEPDELPRYVDGALAATDRVVRIVRRLLDAGRVGHTDSARLEPFFVAPVVRAAISMVERHLNGVHVSLDTDEGLTAMGDPGLVSQVIENLLVNASHALEGRAIARIDVRAERVEQLVRVVVSDNGPGVPEEIRGRLFEPFVTTKVIGKGSGLGLAVSMGLMRSQNGDLSLVRSSRAGTEMALQLPWTPMAPAEADVSSDGAALPEGLKLLIIDDERDVREMLHDICSVLFDVVSAGSIAEAMASVDRGRIPDVVMCDLMMPDGGADEWLARCRASRPALGARTVIITGGPATPQDEALIAANADRVLFKPFNLKQLQSIVNHVKLLA